jgi:hypothetical protein
MLQLDHNSGFFSCCSVACYEIINFIKNHKSIPVVDFSKTFSWYKDHMNQDVHGMYFKYNKSQVLDVDKISKMKYQKGASFNYINEDLTNVDPIIEKWFTPSNLVYDYVEFFVKKYEIHPENILAICFRGTDKYTEIEETSYKTFLSHVPNIIKAKGINRVFIQTDQTQFIDFFKNSFPDISFFTIKEIPTTKSKRQLYSKGGVIKKDKVLHAQMFFAAMQILSSCKFLINHTGNVARWIVKYRGSTKNMIQYKGNKLLCDDETKEIISKNMS